MHLKDSRGFTLIELLVGLLIIGLIVGLFVGIFGSPIQSAAIQKASTQMQDHIRSLQDGASYYTTQKTSEITDLADMTDVTKLNPTPLTNIPVPPASAKSSTFTKTYDYILERTNTDYSLWSASGVADVVVTVPGVTPEVCLKLNQDSSVQDSSAVITAIPTALSNKFRIQCWNNGGTYTIVGLIYPH